MTAIQTFEPAPVVETPTARPPVGAPQERKAAVSMTELLYMAVEKGTPVEALEKLVALHERMSQQQAEQDFSAALARFKAECPPISKSKTANVTTNSGGLVSYAFAPIEEIDRVVTPVLARHGLSFSWGDMVVNGGSLTLSCTVRHENGASRSSSVTLPTESKNPLTSPQQKTEGAWSFARRMSLTAVLGLTTTGDAPPDAYRTDHAETITEDQATALADLIAETQTDLARFLKYFKVGRVDDLPASRYAEAQRMLESKRGGA